MSIRWRWAARWGRRSAVYLAVGIVSALLPLATIDAGSAERVVVAGATVMHAIDTGRSYARVDPLTVYERGRYYDGTVLLEDFRLDEAAARKLTILRHVKEFWLYQNGRLMAGVRVRQIASFHPGCYSPIVGFGDVRWFLTPDFRNGRVGELLLDDKNEEVRTGLQKTARRLVTREFELDGISPRLPVPTFFHKAGLTTEMRGAVEVAARGELKRAQQRRARRKPFEVAGGLRLGNSTVLDVDRDGIPEIVAEFSAPLRTPATIGSVPSSDPEPLFLLLIVVRQSEARTTVLLSLPTIPHEEKPPGSYRFSRAMDLSGDGKAELLIHRTMHEGGQLEVFELRSRRFVRVLEGSYLGC